MDIYELLITLLFGVLLIAIGKVDVLSEYIIISVTNGNCMNIMTLKYIDYKFLSCEIGKTVYYKIIGFYNIMCRIFH